MSTGTVVFLVLLPFATSFLGAVLGLLDRANAAQALRRIAWRGLPFLAAGWLLGRTAALPALAAIGTAMTLHLLAGGALRLVMRRRFLTGGYTPWWGE